MHMIVYKMFDNGDIEGFFTMFLLLYFDDTVLLVESASELQFALNSIYLYCET